MSNYDHWMRFNIGDYLADTMHLSALQHGMYVLLIMHYFKRGPLPADDKVLARIAKVTGLVWRQNSAPVVALFRREKSVLKHTRIDQEIAISRELSAKRANAGKSGASRRWGMANANDADGNCDSTHARATPTTTAKANNPPRKPPNGGPARARRSNKPQSSRNEACDMLAEELTYADEAADAHPGGAAVVPFARRAHRRAD